MLGPWTERHRPKTLAEVHGNPQAVQEMRRWAEAWRAGQPKERAIILAGPPGCGKTSAAHALAQEMGWEVIELNASDARNAAAIERVAGMGARHETFSLTGEYRASRAGQRKLIVLDEADNLYERSAGEGEDGAALGDRGGKRAIADVVAQTHQPVVLIANDVYQLTRGTGERLARSALKITFRRLATPSIRRLLAEIASREGVEVATPVLEAISARAEGDLRSAINDLEALALGRSRVESIEGVPLGERNRGQTAFEVVTAVFKAPEARQALEAVRELDETPDFILAWLDENVPHEYRDKQDLERAYDRLSRADVYLGRAMRRQQFALWGYATELMALGVHAAKERRYTTPPMYRFPSWIRQMGATKGSRGLRDRVAERMGRLLHMSANAFQRDAWADLRRAALGDLALAESIAFQAELEEDEIAAFLGEDAPSSYVQEVVAHVERRRQATQTKQTEVAVHAPPPAHERPSRGRSARLGDFQT